MKQEDEFRLSRLMSYFLRHRPHEAGLTLDHEGLVDEGELLTAIQRRRGYEWVTLDNIHMVVTRSDKQRFRRAGVRIGARYGHNRATSPVEPGPPVTPPIILYHGTPRAAVSRILAEGLKPQQRQFVHLATTVQTALSVGARRDQQPALLIVRALEAHLAGHLFYSPTAETYLTSHIPPGFIEAAPDSG